MGIDSDGGSNSPPTFRIKSLNPEPCDFIVGFFSNCSQEA